jgi:hypothetical protein
MSGDPRSKFNSVRDNRRPLIIICHICHEPPIGNFYICSKGKLLHTTETVVDRGTLRHRASNRGESRLPLVRLRVLCVIGSK